ncbi:MarR family transcriptional regulator [Cytobacillus depressus]|uniref:MarR family transcriptional regulator n=1 Tax=Cytobacillus depressus TaxID=1602942 RepID=A0A6L3V4U2_9BACI|nr:MarR family transcriptional regulator [Cytobacillus depressus]KAB2336129.1 MarR family transcriptional regulator [Cytobacillus depressus]
MDLLVNRIQIALELLKRNLDSDFQNTIETPITKPQMFLMYGIYKRGKCKLSALAEIMEVKPSAITVMIDRLEREGYVKRSHDIVDRRAVFVELTPLGKEVLEKVLHARNKILKSYLARLEQEEIHLFTELLEKMVIPER